MSTEVLRLMIQGKASPSGSKKAFVNKYTGKAHVVDTAKNKDQWQAYVKLIATQEAQKLGLEPSDGAFHLQVIFAFSRPKSHYKGGKLGGTHKETAPQYYTQKPDVTKLVRCLEDALKGVAWHDDSQVIATNASKCWTPVAPWVEVVIYKVG